MSTYAWPKSAVEIVNEIDDQYAVGWDTDANINILTSFIEEHCDPAAFKRHVKRMAQEEAAECVKASDAFDAWLEKHDLPQ